MARVQGENLTTGKEHSAVIVGELLFLVVFLCVVLPLLLTWFVCLVDLFAQSIRLLRVVG
jgi:uncharacterized membrane protein